MKESEETERQYFIKRTENGIYIDDIKRGFRFFQTKNGAWFLLTDGNSIFDEDTVVSKEMADYLTGLVNFSVT